MSSINVGTYAGIPVKIHLSILILVGWVLLTAGSSGLALIIDLLFVALIFVSVTLHEFGHALAAKQFNIATRDITLYPFGGIASIEKEPHAMEELIISLAGPFVNVLLAFGFGFLGFLGSDFFWQLAMGNLILGVFNLIPAFPMDGGRVLRAFLELRGINNASLISARVGQLIAGSIVLAALWYGNPSAVLVGGVVFLLASQTANREKVKTISNGLVARDVMTEIGQLEQFQHGLPVADACKRALRSLQMFYPVLHAQSFLGVVTREDLIQAEAMSDIDGYVARFMKRDIPSIAGSAPLEELMERCEVAPDGVIAVTENGSLTGFALRDVLKEFIVVKGLKRYTTQMNQKNAEKDSELF